LWLCVLVAKNTCLNHAGEYNPHRFFFLILISTWVL